MTVKELINNLESIQKQFGDVPVLLSCDEEQNCVGEVLEVQCGALEEYDQYTGNKVKVGDRIVVIVPAM